MFSWIWERLFRTSRNRRSSDPPQAPRRNVVVFGESGAGKSSVINLLSGEERANVSSGILGCTFKSEKYDLDIGGELMTLWDTPGLNEGEGGKVPKSEAIVELYKLLHNLSSGVSLLVFVVRGPRIKKSVQQNWVLFTSVICQKKVPVILVITGMEDEAARPDGMDGWWNENGPTYTTNYNMIPDGIACVTATRGRPTGDRDVWTYDDIYQDSQRRVLELIKAKRAQEPLQISGKQWFITVIERSFELQTTWCQGLKMLSVKTVREELVAEVKQELIQDCGMSEEEAVSLFGKLGKVKRLRR